MSTQLNLSDLVPGFRVSMNQARASPRAERRSRSMSERKEVGTAPANQPSGVRFVKRSEMV